MSQELHKKFGNMSATPNSVKQWDEIGELLQNRATPDWKSADELLNMTEFPPRGDIGPQGLVDYFRTKFQDLEFEVRLEGDQYPFLVRKTS